MSRKNNIISEENRTNIVRWYEQGYSLKKISDLLLNITKTSINNVIIKYKNTGIIYANKRGGPRITKASPDLKQILYDCLNEDCTLTLKELKTKLKSNNHFLSITTIHNLTQDMHFTLKNLTLTPVARNIPDVI